VILNFSLGHSEKVLENYTKLLSYTNKVTRNECNDAIGNIVDHIGHSSNKKLQTIGDQSNDVSIPQIYGITLNALKPGSNNERLRMSIYVKLGKFYQREKDYQNLEKTVKKLYQALKKDTGNDTVSIDQGIGEAFLLDIYALEISLCEALNRKTKLKEVYNKIIATSSNTAIQDPRIMGNIHETGGKICMEEGRWSDAYEEFFDAFRNYQEAGNSRARQCLKYVVLANMIALKDINPFDSREAKVYKDDVEINAMVELRQAFENSDVKRFENVLNDERYGVTKDEYIMRYVKRLLRNIRSEVLLKIVQPYRRVTLAYLTKQVNVEKVEEVESLLVELILDEKLEGQIDQISGVFSMSSGKNKGKNKGVSRAAKYVALNDWSSCLEKKTMADMFN